MAASSEKPPGGGMMASLPGDVPGEPVSLGTSILEKGAKVLQSLTPVKQFQQHVCTWALYSHDLTRQIETHHYVSRLNEDFSQCAVFDSDQRDARLIGVEYVISKRLFLTLTPEEQKLWHSHFYEIKTGLWVNPGVPEVVQRPELKKLAKTYGKFWCTWQFDRGDRIPLGVPALMMSPQEKSPSGFGEIDHQKVEARNKKYGIETSPLVEDRMKNIELSPEDSIHPNSDHWKQAGKGFVVELKEVDMVLGAGFPLRSLV